MEAFYQKVRCRLYVTLRDWSRFVLTQAICLINASCFFIWQLTCLRGAHGRCQTKIRLPSSITTAWEQSCTKHRGAERCHTLLIKAWPNLIKARDSGPFHHPRENNFLSGSLEYDIKCLTQPPTIWQLVQAARSREAKHTHVLHAHKQNKVGHVKSVGLEVLQKKSLMKEHVYGPLLWPSQTL